MAELLFPLAAVAGTFLIVIPVLTLVSRTVLARKRRRIRSWADFGSETTFAWLVAPTLLPVVWLTSSALHQSEPTAAQGTCLVDHVQATTCLDAALLLGLLIGGMALALLHEHAHITGFDTLRGFVVRFCLSANPAGALLVPDFKRWRRAREAQCDGQAVHLGGQPLALAEGIPRAARFRRAGRRPRAAAMLCGHIAPESRLKQPLR